jgi:hypothetical protein
MKLYTKFPEFIYEALITKVDYDNGVCTLSPLSPSLEDFINDVPLPNHLGTGNSGIFHGLDVGTRVIAANTAGNGREFSVILGTLPKEELIGNNFSSGNKPQNTPGGTVPYPDIASGRMIVRGGAGNALCLMEDGSLELTSITKKGLFLHKNRLKMNQYMVAEHQASYSNAAKSFSGNVQRSSYVKRETFRTKTEKSLSLDAEIEYHERAVDLGFFTGSKVAPRTYGRKVRNPGISEHRTVYREFASDANFSGFDKEIDRGSGIGGLYADTKDAIRYNEQGNTLGLAPDELVEVISGNVVTLDGKVMDLNYSSLVYGSPNNRVIQGVTAKDMERAKRVSRRGIGHHFQLSTASSSGESNTTVSNFVFDIDKEGVIKMNVPRSTNTGNIPFSSVANFDSETPSISYSNPSQSEPVPVHLRDQNGTPVIPGEQAQGLPTRETGIRFSNTDDNPYFPSGGDAGGIKDVVRINPTKYHNMYAAAERLIANTIDLINIPVLFVDEDGLVTGTPVNKPFQILYPEEFYSDDEDSLLGSGTEEPFPLYMAVAAVDPGPPAIYTGGETLVAGLYYDSDSLLPCSNSFKLEQTGTDFLASTVDSSGKPKQPAGGVSAHLNFEGAIYSSIGADNVDNKSLMLDTQGGVVSWFGQDRNGRSIITQTDGAVLLNVGGSYSGSGANPEDKSFNPGRFELRVNVTDKGFIASEFSDEEGDEEGNPLWQSDIVISLSEKGIVIAGMRSGTPMIIRNQDKIMIESTGSDVVLKGTDVKMVDASGQTKTLKSEGK